MFRWNTRSYLAGVRGLNCETLEDRRLLAVVIDNNWTQLVNPDNGGNTELVSGSITKIPAGPNSALAVVSNFTASDGVDIEIKVDNNGDGIFQANEVFTTAGFGGVDLEALSVPGGSAFPDSGEGIFSIGFSCADPLAADCGGSTSPGTDSVSTAVYVHPIGSSSIDRQAMVTLVGGNSTDFIATIGSYHNVDQADPVGDSDTIGDGVISYDATTFMGHNDEGDVVTSSPAGLTVLNYPNTEPGFGVTVDPGNAALDGVHVRFEDDVNNSARSITVGADQTDILNDGNFPDPGRTQGGASTSATGAFDWTFTDTFDANGARFFSHGAVEINNQDGVVDYDYGDLPAPYQTTLADDGPRHGSGGADCGEQTVSGGEGTNVSVFDLGATSGTFSFDYETYSIPDSVIIEYEGNVIFDADGTIDGTANFVSTNGVANATVNFSGLSSQITVTVVGSAANTAWFYTVGCPTGSRGPSFGITPDAEPDGQPEAMAGMMTGGDDFNPADNSAVSYDYPPPGFDTNEFSSTGTSAGDAGGVTWNFDNWDDSQFESLFFGFRDVTAALDGSPDPLSYFSSVGAVATWTGTTMWDNPNDALGSFPVPMEFRATVSGGYNDWESADPSITLLEPGIGEVVDISAGADFSVQLEFLADTGSGFVPINEIQQPQGPPFDLTRSSVFSAWFEVNAPVGDEDGLLDYFNVGAANEPSDDVQTEMFVSDPMNESMAKVELDIQNVSVDNPGYVTAGIDWNGDGDFDDLHEEFATGFEVTTEGVVAFMVTIPASMNDAVTDDGFTFLRARIHSDPCDTGRELDLAGGHANDGEVEDHKVIVKLGNSVHGVKFEDVDGDGTADENVTIPNFAEGDVNGVVMELQTRINGVGPWVPATDLLGNPVNNIETDVNGAYWFSYLADGVYRVRERLNLTDINNDTITDNQQGLTQVTNSEFPATHVVDLAAGQKIEGLDFLNYVATSIHGVKFDDLDGDGVFDRDGSGDGLFGTGVGEEEGLEGVQFDLYRFVATNVYTFSTFSVGTCMVTTYDWTFDGTATTDVHGEFWFTGLAPGTYVVRENLTGDFEDWVLNTGQQVGDPDTEGVPEDYSCTNTVSFNIGENPNSVPAGELHTLSSRDELQWDADDLVFFDNPYVGQAYNRPMAGETQQEADDRTALKNPSAAIPSLIYGNYDPVDIVGQKFETNLNGGNDGFSGVQFTLTGIDGMGNFVSLTDVTDTNGDFSFEGLKPGQYTITEAPITDVNNDGFDDVTGLTYDNRVFSVTATSGETIDAGDWFNYVSGSIHGVKFEDLDGDGRFDRDANSNGVFGDTSIQEEGLEGVVFDLYTYLGTTAYTFDPYSGVACTVTTHLWAFAGTATTNIHGEFWFSDLEPGQYVVRENLAASPGYEDWVLTTGQQEGLPFSAFDPSGYVCGDPINVGQTPTEADAYTIYSRDELQWDNDTAFTSAPFGGEAYNRRMDGETQAEADARTALKNPILQTSLIFGNYDPVDIVGQKFETNLNGSDDGFSGVQFTLTGFDGMGNFVSLTDVTDTNGDFSFEGLKPGQYTITEAPITDVNNDGFDDVTGLTYDDRAFSVDALSGETIDAGDWVNYVSGSIHGVKFEDLDGDGLFDRDASGDGVFGNTSIQEEGLEGVVFNLYTYLGTAAYTFDPYSGVACTVTTHLWRLLAQRSPTSTVNSGSAIWNQASMSCVRTWLLPAVTRTGC